MKQKNLEDMVKFLDSFGLPGFRILKGDLEYLNRSITTAELKGQSLILNKSSLYINSFKPL